METAMPLRGKVSQELTREILELLVEYKECTAREVYKLMERHRLTNYPAGVLSTKAVNNRLARLRAEGILIYTSTSWSATASSKMRLSLHGEAVLTMLREKHGPLALLQKRALRTYARWGRKRRRSNAAESSVTATVDN
jgi:hypothetical protein